MFVYHNEKLWEKKIHFSFDAVSFDGNFCRVSGLTIDGHTLNVEKLAVWDVENKGFYMQLFFELWIYDRAFSGFQYHSRFVGFWINMTMPI
jgi:hypothetical protein